VKHLLYFAILLQIAFASCNKSSDPSPSSSATSTTTTSGTSTNPTSSATYYLVFYDGTNAVKFEESINGIYNGADSYSGNNNYDYFGGIFTTLVNYSPIFQAGIHYGNKYGISGPTAGLQYYNSFTTGSNTFGHAATTTPGFIINYKDSNNVQWLTDQSTGNQTGSAINITSISAYSNLSITYNVQGTFNCNVYDTNGNKKTLTNGKFLTMFSLQ